MSETEDILHDGKVLEAGPDGLTVEIISQSACASCHAAALCGMGSSKSKIIQLPPQTGYTPGEEVIVGTKRSMGEKAVRLGYIYPLFILVGVLLGTLALGFSELVCGLCAIAGVGLWYFAIWILRNKLKNEYTFYIRKKQ